MRIAVVAQGGLDRSGRERVIPALLWLVERLARNHDVHVFALRHGREPETYVLRGATVHDLGGRRQGAMPGVLWQLRALVRELRATGPFDVFHGFLGGPPGALAAVAGRLLRTPVAVTLADGEFVAFRDIGYGLALGWRGRLLVGLSLRLADRLTAASASMALSCRQRGHGVVDIPLGVDVRTFSPAGAPQGSTRLLQVASLSRVKDQDMLLSALRIVADRVPGVHLDLVGEDTLGGAVQARCAALGLDSHVTFHGFQPTEVVARLCQRADLYVQSSRHEAAGISVLEAAACGVPTVGTAVGYVADWAPDRAAAVPVGDAPGLASAILDLLADDRQRRTLGDAARAWALAHDADWTAARFEELYAEVAQRGGSNTRKTRISLAGNRSSDTSRSGPSAATRGRVSPCQSSSS